MIICYNVYEKTAYLRTCDFRAEFLFEDEKTRRETRVLLPEAVLDAMRIFQVNGC